MATRGPDIRTAVTESFYIGYAPVEMVPLEDYAKLIGRPFAVGEIADEIQEIERILPRGDRYILAMQGTDGWQAWIRKDWAEAELARLANGSKPERPRPHTELPFTEVSANGQVYQMPPLSDKALTLLGTEVAHEMKVAGIAGRIAQEMIAGFPDRFFEQLAKLTAFHVVRLLAMNEQYVEKIAERVEERITRPVQDTATGEG
jgi:hypothetical protein